MAPRRRPPDDFAVSDSSEISVDNGYTPSSATDSHTSMSPVAPRLEPRLLSRLLHMGHRLQRPVQVQLMLQRRDDASDPDIYNIPESSGAGKQGTRDNDQSQASDHDDILQDEDQDSLMSELSHAPSVRLARSERRVVTKTRSKLKRHAESILEGSDISDFRSESECSDEEELNFAPEEEQLRARVDHIFSQEDLDIPDCEDVGQLESADVGEHEEFVRHVRAIDQKELLPVIRKAIKAEADSGSCLGMRYSAKLKEWDFNSFLTLCSMDQKVIGELTYGNLFLAVQRDEELRQRLDKYQEQSKKQPSIYARVHVSRDGSAMSVRDTLRLVKWLRRYISEDSSIVEHERCQRAFWLIDRQFSKRWSREDTDAGNRRSLLSTAVKRSDDRIQVVKKFYDRLQARCEASDEGSLLSPHWLCTQGGQPQASTRSVRFLLKLACITGPGHV